MGAHDESASLPPHTVRVSDRARRIRLTMTPRDGLVVVLPRRADASRVPQLLREHRAWILRAQDRIAERRAHLQAADAPLPDQIAFPAFAESFRIRVVPGDGAARVTQRGDQIVLSGGPGESARRAALLRWLHEAARQRLVPMLRELDESRDAGVRRVQIRNQRTRWGSCSRSGTISLNRDLVFLPRELVSYVMLHELAHLRNPDHSQRFWNALLRVEPDAMELRRAMRDAWRFVPPWATGGAAARGLEV